MKEQPAPKTMQTQAGGQMWARMTSRSVEFDIGIANFRWVETGAFTVKAVEVGFAVTVGGALMVECALPGWCDAIGVDVGGPAAARVGIVRAGTGLGEAGGVEVRVVDGLCQQAECVFIVVMLRMDEIECLIEVVFMVRKLSREKES